MYLCLYCTSPYSHALSVQFPDCATVQHVLRILLLSFLHVYIWCTAMYCSCTHCVLCLLNGTDCILLLLYRASCVRRVRCPLLSVQLGTEYFAILQVFLVIPVPDEL